MATEEETEKVAQELQLIEHNFHNVPAQKQAFNLELNETSNALGEVKKTGGEVYKITGSIMLKSDKEKVVKELEDKEKILTLRVKAIEKQEGILEKKSKDLREEIRKFLAEKTNPKERNK